LECRSRVLEKATTRGEELRMSETFWTSLCGHDLSLSHSLSDDLARLTLTDGTRALFAHAVRINAMKTHNREALTATFLFVAALDLALKGKEAVEEDDGDKSDLSVMTALSVRLRYAAVGGEPNFTELISRRIGGRWRIGDPLPELQFEPDTDVGVSTSVAEALDDIFERYRNTYPVPKLRVSTLLLGVLDASATLGRRLAEVGISVEELKGFARSDPTQAGDQFGGRYDAIARRAVREDETLKARQHAVALATLLRKAAGELCLGVFGHWGIGKTYLAESISSLLSGPGASGLTAALKNANIRTDIARPEAFAQGYEVITFSAWRYRRTPELWVYLYETLSTTCMASARHRWSRVLRYNVLRQGHWPLVFALIATGAALASVSLVKIALGAALLTVADPRHRWASLVSSTPLYDTEGYG
jgi:hypothetical protein